MARIFRSMDLKINLNYIYMKPPRNAQYASLATLAVISMPLLWQISIPVMLISGAMLVVSFLMCRFGKALSNTYYALALIFFALAVVYWQFGTIMGSEGGLSFLVLMSIVKSYESKNIRDWQVLLLASSFLTVGGLLITESPLSAMWAFFSFFLVMSCINLLDGGDAKYSMKTAGAGMLLAFPVMAVMFLAVPRLNEPILRFPSKIKQQTVTGISDKMEPGSISTLAMSDAKAFTATFDEGSIEPDPKDLYWRVLTLGIFDGKTWYRMRSYKAVDVEDAARRVDKIDGKGRVASYSVMVRDMRGMIPTLDYPVWTDNRTWVNDRFAVNVKRSFTQLRSVEMKSRLGASQREDIGSRGVFFYTRLPKDFDGNRKAAAEAKRIRANSSSQEEVVKGILDFMASQGLNYTLEPGKISDLGNAVDTFLYDTKEGFCEHFATSFAFMAREAGVPVRIVAGFQGGERNEDGDFWLVRNSDAHAWNEVWLSDRKMWMRVDPTAYVMKGRFFGHNRTGNENVEAATEGGVSTTWNRIKVYADYYWQKWIVNFNSETQKEFFQKFGIDNINAKKLLIILLVGLIIAILPMLAIWRIRLTKQSHPLYDGFMELKRKVLGAGDARVVAMGPMELREHVAGTSKDPGLLKIIDEYISLRYRSEKVPTSKAKAWAKKVKKYRSAKK